MFHQRRRDFVSSLVCIGFGLIFCIGSIRYGDVRSGIPSAGFFPFVGGIILIFLSLIEMVSAVAATGKKNDKLQEEIFFPQKNSWKKLLLTLLSLFVYALVFEYLGLLITTFLFVIFLLSFIEPQKWKTAIAIALFTSTSSYVLFDLCLKVSLPRGILGI